MNTHFRILLAGLVTLSPFLALAQTAPETEVIERGANYSLVRVLDAVGPEQWAELSPEERAFLEAGGATYTQLASGLNYWDAKTEAYRPSVEIFENFEGGLVARQGQTKVILTRQLKGNAQGSVDVLSADGKRLRSQVFGLAWFDRASGQSVMIAEARDSQAVLVPPNQSVYPDAFQGEVKADLRYTYRMGSFEQDVIIREQPPAPEAYGLDPATTVLEVWTEFLEAPDPVKRVRTLKEEPQETRDLFQEPDIIDEDLTFGELTFVQGKAFALTDAQGQPQNEKSRAVPTGKRWLDLGPEGTFLIEAVEYNSVKADLEALPKAQASAQRQPVRGRQKMLAGVVQDSTRRMASVEPKPWGEGLGEPIIESESPSLMASAEEFTRRPGFVIDYEEEYGSESDFVFEGDETYYISGPFTISDTPVFEGGAVLKFDTDAYLSVPDDIDFQTAMYRPVTFTAKTDGTIGLYVASGTPTSTSYPSAIKFTNQDSYTLEHVRIRYASIAIDAPSLGTGTTTITLRHAQIVNCYRGFLTARSATANLRNVLVSSCHIFLQGNPYPSYTEVMTAQHLTAHDIYIFTSDWNDYMYLYNCLFTDIDYPPTTYAGDGNYEGSSSGVYQTAGAGEFYLADGSPHRGAGDGSIDATLEAELKQRTTYPPKVHSGTLNEDTTWFPIILRDNDGCLDRGYHYPPIDYGLYSSTFVGNGVTLTVEPGTVLASFNQYGLRLKENSTTRLQGAAENRITFCRYESVQEDPQRLGGGSTSGDSIYRLVYPEGSSGAAKTFEADFVDFSVADDYYQQNIYCYDTSTRRIDHLSIRNCRFYNGYTFLRGDGTDYVHEVWNNLFVRGYPYFSDRADLDIHNNLFYRTLLGFKQNSGGSTAWTVQDNVFDDITLVGSNYWNGTHTVSNNAYVNGSSWITGSQESGEFTISSIAYETGHFGDFYIPSSTYSTYLEDAGSRTASAAGIRQYTVEYRTSGSDVKDSGTVDVGFHYVAADANGDPIDTDSDGVPDYLEDADGDGTFETGEYEPNDDLWTDSTPSPEHLAELIMANTGATVIAGSVSYTGADVARGQFGNGLATGLPIDGGVILSSGRISDAVGPNDTEGSDTCGGSGNPSDLGQPGDTDLNSLVNGGPTTDAAVLEFEIYVPSAMTLSFEYIFASEEYLEWVAEFNDPMGIFIDGTNIALVPGTSDPVSVSTVFEIIGPPSSESNKDYYQDNPVASNIFNIQYDGLTLDDENNDDALVATSSTLSVGYYDIKIAIADFDTGNCDPDRILDSALFIKAQTICP